jgi:glyoxylase-like metal-dependent hydrolase (beta-lactamase superfamily II)
MEDEGPRADAAFDADYRPDRVLGDGETLTGNGWTLQAVATPGHTSNHLCFALPEERALFSGDHVMGWSTTTVSPPDGDMAAYMASLGKLQGREDEVYYPAHGPLIDKPHKLLRGLVLHRRQREAQILAELRAGARRIEDMVPSMYKPVDPGLYPAAARSVLAHLIDLEVRGSVKRLGDAWSLTAT